MPGEQQTERSGRNAAKEQRPSKEQRAQIAAQLAHESERRARLGVPAAASGVLYLLSGIILRSTLKGLPSVGVLQGIAPALRGVPNPPVSPRAAEVRYIDHHAFGLIAGGVLQSIAVAFLTVLLLFLLDAVRFRRPETARIAHPAVLAGGVGMAVVFTLHPIVQALAAHSFTTGHDFSAHAANHALIDSAGLQVAQYLGLLAGLGLTVGMVIVVMGAARTGLLARWMMVLGLFAAVLAFTPFGQFFGLIQELIPAFWLVAVGLLLMGRAPEPPAWAAGEAVPWPSAAEQREAGKQARMGKQAGAGKQARARASAEDVAPEPAQPVASSSRRRRKRSR
jgi:hypothetical protein